MGRVPAMNHPWRRFDPVLARVPKVMGGGKVMTVHCAYCHKDTLRSASHARRGQRSKSGLQFCDRTCFGSYRAWGPMPESM